MRRLLLLSIGLLSVAPVFGQKFSKRAQQRQEARKANYFYGASFTFTAGYSHSWLSVSDYTLSTTKFGRSAETKNTHNSWNMGFLYDHALSKKWGIQSGLSFVEKGGELDTYYDGGLGYGPVLVEETGLKASYLSLQGMARYFFPVNYYTRFSINAGFHIDVAVSTDDYFNKWDIGPQVGVGFDWKHLATSVTWQIGAFPNVIDNSDSRLSSIHVNVGVRIWKE